MSEYTITLTIDSPEVPPSVVVMPQTLVDQLLNEFALPAAVSAAEDESKRTVTLGTIEVSNDEEPTWNGQVVDQEVFANMLGDAMIMAAIKYAQQTLAVEDTSNENPGADN